ncbi:recombinase family protein [[Eubacterium] rectale]|uniref:Recombinase family protein n=1 Tax=Agathobacter rectalis TaxID=39491 RepID=A0AAW4UJ59_9FIRM|nr:recombinase family protein [Agathobacter rectalis]
MSRLGRDYIETGNLVERVFPMMNIRFVAITDNYDSSKKDADLMVAVTNIANDLYAKDISKKISSSKQEAMEKGIPTGNVAYGYKVVFNENKVKVMVEDKEAADVVRWIFNEAEKGTLHSVIAAELNAKHILTPAQYKVRHNIEKLEKLRGVKWTVDTISRILKNEVYIGRYVTGKDRVCLYRHEKRHTTNKDEWYVFENHHIALIAKEQFYAVQKNKRKVIKPAKNQTVNMLKGKIICGCCGSSIHIHPEKHAKVYLCTHRKRYGKDSCNCLPVKVDDVYAAVLAVIKEQIQVFVDREMILKEHHNDSRVIRQEQVYTEAVNKCVKEMDRLMELKSGLYADYTEELLDEKEYLQLNREYSQRIEKLKIQADEYRQAASQYESAEKTVAQLKAEMLRFKGKRKLTQEMVDLFVAQVRIYENKNLEIVLNYEDELKKFAELNMEREAG